MRPKHVHCTLLAASSRTSYCVWYRTRRTCRSQNVFHWRRVCVLATALAASSSFFETFHSLKSLDVGRLLGGLQYLCHRPITVDYRGKRAAIVWLFPTYSVPWFSSPSSLRHKYFYRACFQIPGQFRHLVAVSLDEKAYGTAIQVSVAAHKTLSHISFSNDPDLMVQLTVVAG